MRALEEEDVAGTGEMERRTLLRILYAAGVDLSDAEARPALHLSCTFTPALHLICTCSAPDLHLICT